MDKITILQQRIKQLEKQKKQAQKMIREAELGIDDNYGKIAQAYQNFYTEKRNREFVLYDKYPSMKALEIYTRRIWEKFPLHEYGSLNIKELAEMIKHLYQFKTGVEHKIYTMGAVELKGEPVYGGQSYSSVPHLYFMVGTDTTLAEFQEYNAMFVNSDKLDNKINLNAKGQGIICIPADTDYQNDVGIECLTGHIFDTPGFINYFDESCKQYMSFVPSLKKQIFSNYLRSSMNYSGGYKMKGIKDVLDFNIHPFDTYIAKVLISTIIYKRNNNIEELTNEDYKHIFDVLYGEQVNIVEDSQKDIPRKLLYVPNKRSGR